MLALFVYSIPYVLGVILLISAAAAFTNLRRARRAPYFRIRNQAFRQGWRWVLTGLIAVAGLVLSIAARQSLAPPDLRALVPGRAQATPTFELVLVATATQDPDLTPKLFEDLPPTITPTVPTPTGTPTPPIATIQSVVTPPADAQLVITAIASDISSSLRPVNPGETFPAGVARLYFFVEFSNMADGMSWSRVLVRNGAVIRSESESWDRGPEGDAYYWFGAQGGWPAGSYEIQFYLGDRLVASRVFTIVN